MPEYKEFRLGDLFTISTPKKRFNANTVKFGGKHRYVVRSEANNGIRGYITENEYFLNPANTISFGQDTTTMFFQDKPYFTGDKIKVFSLKGYTLNREISMYLIAAMKKAFVNFGWGKSSFNVNVLKEVMLYLPITADDAPEYAYMESCIRGLEEVRINELVFYLAATGLADCKLTAGDRQFLSTYYAGKTKYKPFQIIDIFDVKNTQSILSRDITLNSGTTPYLTASSTNNAVGSYIAYDDRLLDKGNCIFIGGKTFVVSYQEKNFFSNDSHNLALYLKESEAKTRENQLFMAAAIYKSLSSKYSWGDSISYKKIQTDVVNLPIDGKNCPDYAYMTAFIRIQQKLAIKKIFDWKEKK
ncbi:hypothetical protein FACS1894124_5130 [Spirochaetia bacterium]|nr:hypothetical protein FACS1894124_5130 [Spirochaetia bacterium]